MNIAVGGYGGAPCYWGEKSCGGSAGWEGEFRRGSAMRDRTRSRRRDHLGKARARRRDSRNSRARSKRSKRRQRSSRRRRSLTVKRGEGRKRVGARRSLESLFHWRRQCKEVKVCDMRRVAGSFVFERHFLYTTLALHSLKSPWTM
eukprot:Skav233136  [mRNA]  locus=scaffold792:219654:224610:+ [translate_table: standard]